MDALHSTSSSELENRLVSVNAVSSSQIRDASFDDQGQLIVVGSIRESITLGGEEIKGTQSSQPVGYVGKISLTGKLDWFHVFLPVGCQVSCENSSIVAFVEIDSAGEIYIKGTQRGSIIVDGVEIASPNFGYGNSNSSSFVMKFSRDGDLIRYNHYFISSSETFLDYDEDLWVYGSTRENWSVGGFDVETSDGNGSIYFSKLSSNGEWTDVKSIPKITNNAGITLVPPVVTAENVLFFGYSVDKLQFGDHETCNGCPFAMALSPSEELTYRHFDFDFLEGFKFYPREGISLMNGNVLLSGSIGNISQRTITDYTQHPYKDVVYLVIDWQCPAVVEYTQDGQMVQYLTCESFDPESKRDHQILGLKESSNGQIFFSGVSFGDDIFLSGHLIEGSNRGKLWIGELDSNLSIKWSSTPFDGYVWNILESAFGEIVFVGNTNGGEALFGRNSQLSSDEYTPLFLILIIEDFEDIDQDGIPLVNDICRASEMGWESNASTDNDRDGCKDSTEDRDDDNDGCEDIIDIYPLDSKECFDTDSDGIGNNVDLDDDGDKVPDENDVFPLDPAAWNDTDNDGMPDQINRSVETPLIEDIDDDGDGVNDTEDVFPLNPDEWNDLDSDGIGDNSDDCIGTYGTSTVDRIGCLDQDGDGVSDLNDIEPYNSDVGLDEYDGPRKDLPKVSEDENNNTSTKSDKISNNLSSVGIPLVGVLSIIAIALLIRRFRDEDDDDDDDGYVNEEYYSIDNVEEEQEDSDRLVPDFDITGEAHESGYEVLEYPVESEKWWWKDEENQCWVPWE